MGEKFVIGLTADFLYKGELQYQDIGLSILDSVDGIQYRFFDRHELTLTRSSIQGMDALICQIQKITADTLAQNERLMAIARFGVGYDSVDVDACTEADVALFITAGTVNFSVAEAIVAWMLALSHHLIRKDRLTREGKWDQRGEWMGSELRHKVVGVIGLGGIGSCLVELLRPFRTSEILAYDPYVSPHHAASLGVRTVELQQLLQRCDFLVVSCPLNKETHGLIGESELTLMKQSAYLINVARGGIIEEDALVEVLRSKSIAGIACDVFAVEPIDHDHPLCHLDNTILAPHSIAWTHELFQEIGNMCCRQLVSLFKGTIPAGLVNSEVVERSGFIKKLEQLKKRGKNPRIDV